jgi:hypothetical protein
MRVELVRSLRFAFAKFQIRIDLYNLVAADSHQPVQRPTLQICPNTVKSTFEAILFTIEPDSESGAKSLTSKRHSIVCVV